MENESGPWLPALDMACLLSDAAGNVRVVQGRRRSVDASIPPTGGEPIGAIPAVCRMCTPISSRMAAVIGWLWEK